MGATLAPALQTSDWLNSAPLDLTKLRGKVVALHFFQMLCPGCVVHGVPQAQRLYDRIGNKSNLIVVAVHSVFEHHHVMTRAALDVFVHEFRLTLPIAVDAHVNGDRIPASMQAYQVQGTPTWVLLDKAGYLRANIFGQLDDLALGLHIGSLLAES